MLLRRYHNIEEPRKEIEEKIEVPPLVGEDFIEDVDKAYELAIEENNIKSLEVLKVSELKELAKTYEIESYSKMEKKELIAALAGE